MLKRGNENKYEQPYSGPHTILKVFDNGTVRMQVKNVEDTYNIRRLTPFTDPQTIDQGEECNMQPSDLRRSKRRCLK